MEFYQLINLVLNDMVTIFLAWVLIVATVAAFFLSLLKKWGVIEYVQVHGNDFFCKMFNCNFCLSWWMCVVLSVIIAMIAGNFLILLTPFCSTVLTRILL